MLTHKFLKTEMERLDMVHILMIKGSDDKLYHAPIEKEKVHRILDIGTGTGACTCVVQKILSALLTHTRGNGNG